VDYLHGGDGYPSRCLLAIAAPSHIARSFAHTTSSATGAKPVVVSKPQSVPAITRRGSPIACATRSMRSATSSGCST
jgi:hypothetical protein